MSPARSTDRSVGALLHRADQAMIKTKNAALKPVGLTLAQLVALVELEERPGITAAALARACTVTPQAMMVLLKSMELQGLLGRRPHPLHENVLEVHMTNVGREALHAGRAAVAPIERRVWASLTATEVEALCDLLSRFTDAIEGR